MTVAITPRASGCRERIRFAIRGVVQGMGFRPFIFRLAHELSLAGWIVNSGEGATLEVEGETARLQLFQSRLQTELPQPARIQAVTASRIPPLGEQTFSIRPSRADGQRLPVISPDLATCRECQDDIENPQSRRYRYPLTTCTQCGPRYTIVTRLPYDRPNTSMDGFPLCDDCRQEYEDPSNRRFHAETISCPRCGPHIELWSREGKTLAEREQALLEAGDIVRHGGILAVKGLGGFQLWVQIQAPRAIQRLRQRKHRPAKPFAVLFPSLTCLKDHCLVSPEETELLTSPAAPIVLLRKITTSAIPSEVAPGNPYVGAMLPHTPLHHLMMADLSMPVVATSGNRSDEPLVCDEQDALDRLQGIADAFLVHNRPIIRPVDDSVVRVVEGGPVMLRRARGYVPTPLSITTLPDTPNTASCIVAVGGHLKNTIAVTMQNAVCVSQHLGDLSTVEASARFEQTVSDLLALFHLTPQAVACDSHPDYRSGRFARQYGLRHQIPVLPVQHHHAHIAACMAEQELDGPVLGVAWDGAGYGNDHTVWGGEFFICEPSNFHRIARLRPFALPGGEICMREPRRVALSLLSECVGHRLHEMNLPPLHSLGPATTRSLMTMMDKKINCPLTSSIGRLFDGVSALMGLIQVASFEGEAAMALEFLTDGQSTGTTVRRYDFPVVSSPEGGWVADWRPLMSGMLHDMGAGRNPADMAYEFHHALASLIVDIASRQSCPHVVLSGGVFQNPILFSLATRLLTHKGFSVYSGRRFGTHDGGLSLGQSLVALHTSMPCHSKKAQDDTPVTHTCV